jgi:predicted nucleic acid-binding protein
VLAFDERVAPTYARVFAALREAGTPVPSNDLAIGALAIHFGHELLVGPRDEGHFRRIPGLVVRLLAEPVS